MKKYLNLVVAALFALSMSFATMAFADPPMPGVYKWEKKTMVAKTVKKAEPKKAAMCVDAGTENAMIGQVILEAMWTSGGEKYREAVSSLSHDYLAKMDKNCKVKAFDVGMAAKNYRGVYVPVGAEVARDKLILKQVGTMACIMNAYMSENAKAAAIQKLWKL